MFWLKQTIGSDNAVTEISASDKLESFRAQQDGYLGASFAPISAFGEHGAVVHYSATPGSNASLHEGGMLLTDTGGHYWKDQRILPAQLLSARYHREKKRISPL